MDDASVCCGSAITAIAEALDEIPFAKNAHGDGPVRYALVLTIDVSQPDDLILHSKLVATTGYACQACSGYGFTI